jgi:hypothetical protein
LRIRTRLYAASAKVKLQLADLVGGLSGGTTIERAVTLLAGHVRCHLVLPQLLHEGGYAVSPVVTERDPSPTRDVAPRQTVTVLGEYRRVLDAVVPHAQSARPTLPRGASTSWRSGHHPGRREPCTGGLPIVDCFNASGRARRGGILAPGRVERTARGFLERSFVEDGAHGPAAGAIRTTAPGRTRGCEACGRCSAGSPAPPLPWALPRFELQSTRSRSSTGFACIVGCIDNCQWTYPGRRSYETGACRSRSRRTCRMPISMPRSAGGVTMNAAPRHSSSRTWPSSTLVASI